MFNFRSLYSGSSGNSLFVQTNHTKILIDAGKGAKRISDALLLCDVTLNDIDAILVTHEHTDHIKSLGTISKKYNIPVYANKETWDAMPEQSKKILDECKKIYIPNESFEIKDLKIEPFKIPHDAANPCGFNIFYKKKKLSIATDLGHVTEEVFYALEKSNFALVEANYDINTLKCSRYPYALKQRIAGPNGHLSNNSAGTLISNLMKSGLNNVMLGHLSKENNFPELAYSTVVEELINSGADESSIHIDIAQRNLPSRLINIS